jgi:Zn-finger protein
MEFNYQYFENRACEHYPCHDIEHINCLFCYCPLYDLKCPGNYKMIAEDGEPCPCRESGTVILRRCRKECHSKPLIKDCSACTITHDPKNSWKIIQKYLLLNKKDSN